MQNRFFPASMPERNKAFSRPPRGVALILVLAIIVLITGLVVAFFSSVTTELVSEKSYASGGASKQLADAATQLAIGSIRKATSQTSANDPSGTSIAWSSQPGMIRTWDSTGTPLTCYKLFSSDTPEVPAPYVPANDIAQDFESKPQLYTDLNAPIALPRDPNAIPDPLYLQDQYHTLHYPIMDPSGAVPVPNDFTQNLIAGFSISPGAPPTSKVPNPAPMPVRWLYILQDGTLTAPQDGGGTGNLPTANFTGAVVPTGSNPIVGRIAYWTDDESCKVNINTASEGVYWDMPRIATKEDMGLWSGSNNFPGIPGLSLCQPAKGEFQRYPGHPATTSLSPILAKLGPLSSNGSTPFALPPSGITRMNNGVFQTYYDLVPRIQQGGSMSGTVIANRSNSTDGQLGYITADGDRLFASVDELIFNRPGPTPPPATSPARSPFVDANNQPVMDKVMLEKAKFLLTAHSSAPEVTIFNTPRVSMWPVWKLGLDGKPRTLLDNQLAFCANLKKGTVDYPYYFTREDSRDMHKDYDNSPRNIALYAYLRTLMTTPVPGFGGTFQEAFGAQDNKQVLTSIYDYIRCINLFDASPGTHASPGIPATPAAVPYTKPVRINQGDTVSSWGGGEILPIKIPGDSLSQLATQGFGRFATLSGVDIAFCAVTTAGTSKINKVQAMLLPTFFSPMQGLPGMYPKVKFTITGQENFTLDNIKIFLPGGTAWITNAPVQDWEGRGMGSMISPRAALEQFGEFTTPFTKYFAPGESNRPKGTDANNIPNYRPILGPGFPAAGAKYVSNSGSYPFVSHNPVDRGPSENHASDYDYQSPNIVLSTDPAKTTMNFVGGDLKITLASAETGETIQTFTVTIPNAPALPLPRLPSDPSKYVGPFMEGGTALLTDPYRPHRGYMTHHSHDPSITLTDIVRGVEVAGSEDSPQNSSADASTSSTAGDARMIAALPNVSNIYYHNHHDWNNPAVLQATGMEDDDGTNRNLQSGAIFNGDPAGVHGSLVAGMNSRGGTGPAYQFKQPYVPSRVKGVMRRGGGSGDWDTGFAMLPDGAHINMGDIGDQAYIDEVNTSDPDVPSNYLKPRYPYVVKEDHFFSSRGGGTYFSPNRQVPSSMILGSIPTGVQRFQPWQTLLFNPKPEDPSHPGRWVLGKTPPDHLIADFFWMPVVEPYPISQPFSTAGKINMNYQIAPFSYINRSTGIYAVMKATKMMAMPTSLYTGNDPKPFFGSDDEADKKGVGYGPSGTFRYPIDVQKTLAGFENYFASKQDIFRSASQICELNLVPAANISDPPDYTDSSMARFWTDNPMTGDNLREKPYVDIYPRLTTKSNSFTVHFRVQVLQKSSNSLPAQWIEGRDQVISEYRGSSEIERYLDSNDPNLPDFAQVMASNSKDASLNLDKYYHYRVVSTKRFSPY